MLWTGLALSCLAGLASAANYTNPLRLDGPDPFIVYDNSSSKYYYTTTTNYNLQITSASTLDGLRANPDRRLVYRSDYTVGNGTTWAPELHKLDGKWHLYFSLDYHPWVLTGGSNPFDAYSDLTQLYPDWGIDGTVLQLNQTNYFVWSCLRNLTGFNQTVQSLCISKLTSPTKIDMANIGVISQPDQPWEQVGPPAVPAVNEGPQPLYWKNNTYLTYSASFCGTANYSLGLLHYLAGDPLQASSWKKRTAGPVFAQANGNYGTGHNGIFVSPDGKELWNVFHAVQNPIGSCLDDRASFAMKVNTTDFDPAQGPNFGQVGFYGAIMPGPSGEPPEPETINDARGGICDACWTDK